MYKIGIGYDQHRLIKNRPLILGGVQIAFDRGLEAHSDGDVLIHAICEAILGALGKKDMGAHFPALRQYKNISSLFFLEKIREFIEKSPYQVNNLDASLLAQSPKLSPYRKKMCQIISSALRVRQNIVNLKFTTFKGIGMGGKEEGIAANAVVLLKWKK